MVGGGSTFDINLFEDYDVRVLRKKSESGEPDLLSWVPVSVTP